MQTSGPAALQLRNPLMPFACTLPPPQTPGPTGASPGNQAVGMAALGKRSGLPISATEESEGLVGGRGFEPLTPSVSRKTGALAPLGAQPGTRSRKPIFSNRSAILSDSLWDILLSICCLIARVGHSTRTVSRTPKPKGPSPPTHASRRRRARCTPPAAHGQPAKTPP